MRRIHLLPVYNSLPNRDKNIGEVELIRRYLEPYFLGTCRYVRCGMKYSTYEINVVVHKTSEI